MAFWNKGKDKRPIIEVIKYEGPNDILIWKYPHEDFNTNTQLVVGPSQEAIFVKGGQVVGRFGAGTHTLDTKNNPFLRGLIGLVTGGVSPFSCVVYYVNKVVSMGIDWGTDSPISLVDPIYGVPVEFRGNGDFSLQVVNGHMLLERLVGQTRGYSHDEIRTYFAGLMEMHIRGVISRIIQERGLSAIGIDAHLASMSVTAAEQIAPIFEPYGLAMKHFTIRALGAPELDAFKNESRKAQMTRMSADVDFEMQRKGIDMKAYENRALGVTEQDKWVAGIGQTIASNPGKTVTQLGGVGILGQATPTTVIGDNPGASAASAVEISRMLMNNRGSGMAAPAPVPEQKPSFEERVRKLKFMLDNGAITREAYQKKIDEIMSEI